MVDDPEEEAVREDARRLRDSARWWRVEIPEDWYVTGDDFESFIGGLYHDQVRARIRNTQLTYAGIALAILGLIVAVASC